jgi:hypothetical protein
MNAVGVRIGQIIVRDVSEARLRTAFPSDPPPMHRIFDLARPRSPVSLGDAATDRLRADCGTRHSN